jgi:hypothetical protein
MEKDLIYKINKYKTKYINLKNQFGGDVKTYIDELSYDTMNLIVSRPFLLIGWKQYDEFVSKVKDFGIEIKDITLVNDWAQDFIKSIYIENSDINFIINICNIYEKISSPKIKEFLSSLYPKLKIITNDIRCTTIREANNFNLQKGGNYIILPNEINNKKIITMKSIEDTTKAFCEMSNNICLQIYLPNFNINSDYFGTVFHIDEILCLIPIGLGIDDYEVWFYDPLCDDFKYQTELKTIQENNKTILHKYFNVDKIKYFPLKFSNTGYIISPPLFNRIILRNNNQFRIIFPDQSAEIKALIDTRLEEIKTTFNHIIYDYIDTTELHNMNGNIHCGFKNLPIL